jgi:hypothetical protein
MFATQQGVEDAIINHQQGVAPISRIGKFNPNPALEIAEEDRAVLCRQPR